MQLQSYQITSAIIGLVIAGLIVWLIRRDHLQGKYGVWWLTVATGFAVIGVAPTLVDSIAIRLGISYPPILVVILGMGFLVIKLIIMDIERSKSIVRLERLAQELAILELELSSFRQAKTEKLPLGNKSSSE